MSDDNALEQFFKILPVMGKMHELTDHFAHLALLPLFLLSIFFSYSTDLGLKSAVFMKLRNLVITVMLLYFFPKIATGIKLFGQDLAFRLDDMKGFDEVLRLAKEKIDSFEGGPMGFLGLGLNAILASLSYFLVYLAKFLLLAFYQFYFAFLFSISPFLILGSLFNTTADVTRSLFKSICLISAWPIVWAILSAFLKSMAFADAYKVEGNYFTILCMNIVVALSMLFSPFILSFLFVIGGGEKHTPTLIRHIGSSSVALLGEAALHSMTSGSRRLVVKAFRKSKKMPASQAGRVACFILFFIFSAKAICADVNSHVGQSTLICLRSKPQSAILSSNKSFDISKIGPHIILRALEPSAKAELMLVYGQKVKRFALTSDPDLPHQFETQCEKEKPWDQKSEPKRAIKTAKVALLPTDTTRPQMTLENLYWSNSARDYLILLLKIDNDSKGPLHFDWASLRLTQQSHILTPSKTRAARRFLPTGASMSLFVEFRRPSLSSQQDAYLHLRSNKGNLETKINRREL
jgi:hypothetical protein